MYLKVYSINHRNCLSSDVYIKNLSNLIILEFDYTPIIQRNVLNLVAILVLSNILAILNNVYIMIFILFVLLCVCFIDFILSVLQKLTISFFARSSNLKKYD